MSKKRPTAARAARPRFADACLPLGALAAGFGLLSSAALAQPAPASAAGSASAPDVGSLPVVRVKADEEPRGKDAYQTTETRIGKGRQDIRDIPQALTVITEKVMDDRDMTNVKDVLKRTSGITFQAAEGGEEDIKLHGISLQSTGDIFIDGMRDPAFYDRDTFFLDRVEVLRGSASLLFGRGSTGGAVNQVTKQARLVDESQVDVMGGSHGLLRVVGDFSKRTGETSALRVDAMVHTATNDGAGTPIKKQGAGGSFRTGIGEQDEFGLTLYGLKNDNGVNYGIPWIRPTATAPVATTTLVPTDPDRYYGMSTDRNNGSASYAMLDHVHRFDGGAELVSKVRYATYTRDLRASLVRFATGTSLENLGPATVLTRSLQLKKQDMQTLSAQSDFSGKFKLAGVENNLQAGVDFSHEKKQVYTPYSAAQGGVVPAKPNTLFGTPDDGAGSDESLRSFRTSSDYVSKGFGGYVQDMIQVAPMWKVLGGLRYDHLEGDYSTYAIPNNAPSPTTRSGYTMKVAEWSKRGAILFQPNGQLSFHLMGATSFNTSGDTYSLSAQNQSVPPEESINVELGAKVDSADGKLSGRIAIFKATKLHERNTDPLNNNLTILSGKRHAAGVDMDIVGRVTPKWEVFGNLTWMPVAKIDIGAEGAEGQGTRPSLTPRFSGTLWNTYQFDPQWRAGLGLNGRSPQQPNRNPGFYAPRFLTGDLMAEFAASPELTFKLNVTNVTNKLYAEALYTAFYVPGTGRVVTLTGSYKF